MNPNCGHRWPRIIEGRARQCPQCWTTDIIPEEDYENMVNIAVNMGENPGPLIDAAISVFNVQGLTMRPLRTLGLIKRIIEEAGSRRFARGASVVELI